MTKEILTFDEFVNYTGLSVSSAYKAVHQKEITYYKPRGGKLYFELKDVKAWLLRGKVSSNEAMKELAQAV